MRLIDAGQMEKHIMESKVFTQYFKELVQSLIWGENTVDAVPVVRGEWIQKHHIISLDNMTLTGTYPTCSLCGYAWIGVAKNTNYCPNCGAKMEDKPCE